MHPPKCSMSISTSVRSRDAQSPSHTSEFLVMFIEEVSHLRIILKKLYKVFSTLPIRINNGESCKTASMAR